MRTELFFVRLSPQVLLRGGGAKRKADVTVLVPSARLCPGGRGEREICALLQKGVLCTVGTRAHIRTHARTHNTHAHAKSIHTNTHSSFSDLTAGRSVCACVRASVDPPVFVLCAERRKGDRKGKVRDEKENRDKRKQGIK